MKYKKGDVIFFEWDNFGSKCVQAYNKLFYGFTGPTHVGIVGEVQKDSVLIYEALSKGFIKSWYDKESLQQMPFTRGRFNTNLTNVVETLEKYLGRPYGWIDVLGIIISRFTGYKIHTTGSQSIICSEAVARFLYDASNKKLNLSEYWDIPYDLLTPMDIYLYIQIHGRL